MRAYSPDLRAKILAAVDSGMTLREAARVFGVGTTTIKRYARQRRLTGSLEPRRHPGRLPKIRPHEQEALRAQLAMHPTAVLTEHCTLWEASHGTRLSIMSMSRAIRKLGWTRKKDRWVPPSGTSPIAGAGIA